MFRAFGVHFGGPGAPLALFWSLGAPRAIQDFIFHFFRLLERFGDPGSARMSPKGRKGDQNCSQCDPEDNQKRPRKRICVEISEILILYDSIMLFMVFGVRESPSEVQQNMKKRLKREIEKKNQKSIAPSAQNETQKHARVHKKYKKSVKVQKMNSLTGFDILK